VGRGEGAICRCVGMAALQRSPPLARKRHVHSLCRARGHLHHCRSRGANDRTGSDCRHRSCLGRNSSELTYSVTVLKAESGVPQDRGAPASLFQFATGLATEAIARRYCHGPVSGKIQGHLTRGAGEAETRPVLQTEEDMGLLTS
jgi:hypothetical protein